MQKNDLSGQIFGRLTVIKQIGKDKWGAYLWLCRCNCSNKNITIVRGNHLKRNAVKSCGCLRNEVAFSSKIQHGYSNDPIYYSWRNMVQRCVNPDNVAYHNYGGRGIKVCERWLYSFPNFKIDMPGWQPGLQIEREKNNEGYCPENCYWATRTQQARNRRDNLYVTHRGETQLLIELAEKYKIPYKVIWARIYTYNWSLERALATPARKKRRK